MVASIILLYRSLAIWALLGVAFNPFAVGVFLLLRNFLLPLVQHFAANWLVRGLLALEAEVRLASTFHTDFLPSFVLASKMAALSWAPLSVCREFNEGLEEELLVPRVFLVA